MSVSAGQGVDSLENYVAHCLLNVTSLAVGCSASPQGHKGGRCKPNFPVHVLVQSVVACSRPEDDYLLPSDQQMVVLYLLWSSEQLSIYNYPYIYLSIYLSNLI